MTEQVTKSCVQQLAVQKAEALDNLYTRLCCQTCSRKITSTCVPLMVARLGANWTSALCRELVYPIVQTMVVLEEIGGISSHEEYEEFSAANKASEGTLLQRMQETCNRGAKAMRDKTRELVMFFSRITTANSALFSVSSGRCLAWLQTEICFLSSS